MVSVIMPTYNTDLKMLSEAIDSILEQDYSDFELIIIDDGSTDDSNYNFIVKNYNDKRVIPIKNPGNMGVAKTLNRGLDMARGDIICRMDADDIAKSNRISTIVRYFETHPKTSVVGSFASTFGAKKTTLEYPLSNTGIRIELLYNNPFCHPAVAYRRSLLDEYNIHYPTDVAKEDYNMWVNLSKYDDVIFENIPVCLLNYRVHNNQVTKRDQVKLKAGATIVTKRALEYFGVKVENELIIDDYVKVNYNSTPVSEEEFSNAIEMYNLIHKCACGKSEDYKREATTLLSKKIKKIYCMQTLVFHRPLKRVNLPDWVQFRTGNFKLDMSYSIGMVFTRFLR